MNVVSVGMVKQVGLELQPLASIGFYGLTMMTADHKETMLQHWAWVEVGVEGR